MNPTRLRERLSDSLWVLPAILVTAVGLLAWGLISLDRRLGTSAGSLAFGGGPDSAQEILGTIAASMMTFTGLVFSITVVALQLTSSQFSPRVLRSFLRDRLSQVALGVFVATFVYALIALREVRRQGGPVEAFVPGVTVTVAFVLLMLSVATFVQFIHHISQSIRVVNIIDRIAAETERAIERTYPSDGPPNPPGPLPDAPGRVIGSRTKGVVIAVDTRSLVRCAQEAGVVIVLVVGVGDFVSRGAPLLRVVGSKDPDAHRVHAAVTLDRERAVRHDPAYGFRQLVDIAEKALSPGVNDHDRGPVSRSAPRAAAPAGEERPGSWRWPGRPRRVAGDRADAVVVGLRGSGARRDPALGCRFASGGAQGPPAARRPVDGRAREPAGAPGAPARPSSGAHGRGASALRASASSTGRERTGHRPLSPCQTKVGRGAGRPRVHPWGQERAGDQRR